MRLSMIVAPAYNGWSERIANRKTSGVCIKVPVTKNAANSQQSSAIYFKRHKRSKCRAALFRQLRASPPNQTRDIMQQTYGNGYIAQRLRSGQLPLRGVRGLVCAE